MPVCVSRRFGRPRVFGGAVLGDLGEAVKGDKQRSHNAQPDVYRSPEIMLQADWSYAADIWNVGVMVRATTKLTDTTEPEPVTDYHDLDMGPF